MKLPRTETTLAAALLLSAAPFALATPPPAASPTPSTPGATPPETTPSTTNPGMTPPEATSPGSTTSQGVAPPGTTNSGSATAPGTSGYQNQSQDLQRGSPMSSMSSSGWSHNHTRLRSAEHVPTSDINAAKTVKVSLSDAINTAQQQNHGTVVSARFELRQGEPEYLIRSFDSQSKQEWVGHIDANTGQMIGQGETVSLSQLPKEDQ